MLPPFFFVYLISYNSHHNGRAQSREGFLNVLFSSYQILTHKLNTERNVPAMKRWGYLCLVSSCSEQYILKLQKLSTERKRRSQEFGYLLLYTANEQALVCLFNREILDASRGRPLHCKMANNRCWPNLLSH